MSKKVIYSAAYGTGHGSAYPFEELVGFVENQQVPVRTPDELKENNGFLIIWGGEDIHPSIYNQPNDGSSVWGDGPSKHDKDEIALIGKAFDLGMPVLGVCRGAQLCCALAGGKLAQDVHGHGMSHSITTKTGKTLITSSVHHQMMFPLDVEHDLIAWSTQKRSTKYQGLTEKEIEALAGLEPEIVYFPKQRFLAVQGHPEFMKRDCEFNNYVRELLVEHGFV